MFSSPETKKYITGYKIFVDQNLKISFRLFKKKIKYKNIYNDFKDICLT